MRRRHNQLDFVGSLHFITTVARERGQWFTSEKVCTEILRIFEKYRCRYELTCFGYVLMPDHLHALLMQTQETLSVSQFMNCFKRETAKSQLVAIPLNTRTLWRDRFDDVPIPNAQAALERIEYMHNNPVRRGLVEKPSGYSWSSARFYYEEPVHGLITLTRA
ncbi:MAG: REP-associated tyrosine transposase [Calditrichota bacterium]